MATNTIQTRFVLKNDTEALWNSNNPVLMKGEIGIATDVNKMKIGDGTSKWSELKYSGLSPEEVNELIGDSRDNVYIATATSEQTDIEAINAAVGDATVKQADMAVVKRTITGDYTSYTAYIYDGNAWAAMDGNYDAENVYMSKDLTITASVGVQTVGSSGSTTVATAGKNLKQVFDTLFAAEKDPTATAPTVSAVSLSGAAAKEVGTTISPSYSCTFNAGSYTYGPATGITVKTWSITDSKGNTASTSSGTFDSFKIKAGETYNVSATATYTAGATPVTNLGNACEAKKIAAGTTAKKTSSSYTGYRQGHFMGTLTTATASNAITSAIVRNLTTKKNGNYAAGKVTLTVPVGAATIVIACPADKTGITNVLNTTVNADMTSSFVKSTVTVAGADGDATSEYAASYNVWTYSPAEAYGSSASLTVTLG